MTDTPSILGAPMKAGEWKKAHATTERERLENHLAFQLGAAKIPYRRQAKVIAGRKYAFDFLVEKDLLIEVEGGTFSGGRHVRGEGFASGCEKQALAVITGYRVLRVTGEQVESGQALNWIEAAR